MATDLAEFVGAALALNLVFGVPMLPAGMITEMVAFIVLGLQVRGHRPFERAIAALLLIVTGGFAYELLRIQPSPLGLTSRRVDVRDDAKRRQALSFQRWDVITALGLAGIVNLAMLMVAAKLFHSTGNASVSTIEGRARRAQPTRRRGRRTAVRRRAVGIGGVLVEATAQAIVAAIPEAARQAIRFPDGGFAETDQGFAAAFYADFAPAQAAAIRRAVDLMSQPRLSASGR